MTSCPLLPKKPRPAQGQGQRSRCYQQITPAHVVNMGLAGLRPPIPAHPDHSRRWHICQSGSDRPVAKRLPAWQASAKRLPVAAPVTRQYSLSADQGRQALASPGAWEQATAHFRTFLTSSARAPLAWRKRRVNGNFLTSELSTLPIAGLAQHHRALQAEIKWCPIRPKWCPVLCPTVAEWCPICRLFVTPRVQSALVHCTHAVASLVGLAVGGVLERRCCPRLVQTLTGKVPQTTMTSARSAQLHGQRRPLVGRYSKDNLRAVGQNIRAQTAKNELASSPQLT